MGHTNFFYQAFLIEKKKKFVHVCSIRLSLKLSHQPAILGHFDQISGYLGQKPKFSLFWVFSRHYSFVHDSSDELKLCPTREKNFFLLFLFFIYIFTQSVIFLSKMGKICQKCPTKKKCLLIFLIFIFLSSDMDEILLSGFVDKRIQ